MEEEDRVCQVEVNGQDQEEGAVEELQMISWLPSSQARF
jgi:hypothetical protein